jgi:cytochrome c553
MRFRRVFALAAMVLAGSAHAQEAAHATTTVGDAKAGATKAAVCGACHGTDGNSSAPQYPKLAGQHEEYTARQLAMFKSNQRQNAIMAGFVATLSAQDMLDMGAYFATTRSLPGVADEKLLARGQSLYRAGDKATGTPACMACHGPDGRGNPAAGYPQVAGQYAAYSEARLKAYRTPADPNGVSEAHVAIMTGVTKGLSDNDIIALSSYLEGLHSALGQTAAK